MKTLQMIILLTAMALLALPAWSQCPDATGLWTTTDGSMLGGRASEAWCTAAAQYGGVPGNTQNAMSWDGVSLGTQWRAWGMAIDANGATLVADNVVGGNGTRTYQTFYDGGQFWLAGGHTWGDGINDLNGVLDFFQVDATITYIGGNAVGATSNISFTGNFVDCPAYQNCVVQFGITNAMQVWSAHSGQAMPADYPALLCDATGGEAFEVCCITISIDCAVPAESETWSGIKAMYR